MKTHRMWMFALTSVVAMAVGPVYGQAVVSPSFAYAPGSVSPASLAPYGGVMPASYGEVVSDCGCNSGACGSGGCQTGRNGGVCGGSFAAAAMPLQHMGVLQGCGPIQQNGPNGTGGCCHPIWYDVHVEWMQLRRRDLGARLDTTSRNAGGPIVLSTDDLELEDAHGFRATYAMILGVSTNLEVSYFGTHEWDSRAQVTGSGDLFSVFSNYGTQFFSGVQGFPGTVDFANLHTLSISSELHSVEVNMRRRWVSPNCLFHGSVLGGFRYVSLQEGLNHSSVAASGGSLNYDLETLNDAYGFQVGTDLYVCVSPRLKIGAEVEGGIYGNDSAANTVVTGIDSGAPITPVIENESDTDVTFIAEAGAIAMFRLTPRCVIRGGYQVMYLDGMALASENFNTQSPLLPRTSFIENGGDVVLHGATAGLTFTW